MPDATERFPLDTADLGDLIPYMCDWVRSLGLDPDGYRSIFEITHEPNGWHLHLTQALRDPDNSGWLLVNGQMVTTPVDVVLGDLPDLPWLHDLLAHERARTADLAEVAKLLDLPDTGNGDDHG